jgi:hypothetical protein
MGLGKLRSPFDKLRASGILKLEYDGALKRAGRIYNYYARMANALKRCSARPTGTRGSPRA